MTYSEKRNLWLECLCADDVNSIKQQLISMSWDIAAFDALNEARRIGPPADEERVQLSPLLFDLLDRSFFTAQLVAIRRLVDESSLHGKKGVYSLIGLLREMRAHSALITRASIFAAEGLRYDWEAVKRENFEYGMEQRRKGKLAYWVPRELDWGLLERRHKVIDRLTGSQADSRSPDDEVRDSVFSNLETKLHAACTGVKTYVTKFLAHAATAESRSMPSADNINITLGHILRTHGSACQIVSFLARDVLGDVFGEPLAHPLFDQFEHMDKPLVDASGMLQLEEKWRQFSAYCRELSMWGIDEYEREFKGIERAK